mmetsp:Transcript_9970/g.27887  ORF Transcript_9970/g.27887 Transcript_9970/m.27887 type:complete len:217 (-) Transcript_9970:3-653(-)
METPSSLASLSPASSTLAALGCTSASTASAVWLVAGVGSTSCAQDCVAASGWSWLNAGSVTSTSAASAPTDDTNSGVLLSVATAGSTSSSAPADGTASRVSRLVAVGAWVSSSHASRASAMVAGGGASTSSQAGITPPRTSSLPVSHIDLTSATHGCTAGTPSSGVPSMTHCTSATDTDMRTSTNPQKWRKAVTPLVTNQGTLLDNHIENSYLEMA